MAITVHLKQSGKPLVMLLNIVKVPRSHTGLNLALAFVKVLEDLALRIRSEWLIKWMITDAHLFKDDLGCDCSQHFQ